MPLPRHDQTWLVTGASGLLGTALCRHLTASGRRVVAVARDHRVTTAGVEAVTADLRCTDARELVGRSGATHVVHAAAITDVDRCEEDEASAHALHVDVTRSLAAATSAAASRLTVISTDQLWRDSQPFSVEDRPVSPLNVYARTKAAGEVAALEANSRSLVVRTNFFGHGPSWRRSASEAVLDSVAAGGEYPGFQDVWFTPIGLPILCELLVDAIERGIEGLLHVAGGERVSKYEFARRIVVASGLPSRLVVPRSIAEAQLHATRPLEMSLSCARAERALGRAMPNLDESIAAVNDRGRTHRTEDE